MSNIEYFSFSKLEKFDQCPYAYKLRYEDKNFSQASSLAMELGTLAHKCKELIALDLIAGRKPDYGYIKEILYNGYDVEEDDVKCVSNNVEHICGVNELKEKYPFDWLEADNKSGKTYDQKIEIFIEHLSDMEKDLKWKPFAVEVPFEVEFCGKVIKGFIDKIDFDKDENFRIVDYKTSKAIFDDSKVKTSMQMFIYDMAVRKMYDKEPVEHIFDFIFLGKKQLACSKGFYVRGEKKLIKWFDEIDKCKETGDFIPKPTPLCHWCDFCETNTNADPNMKFLCQYHSLWTPSNKVFDVAQEYKKKDENNRFWF